MKLKNSQKPLRLFHTGYGIIEQPDIHFGRSNADFGQGFYLSDDEAFSKRWARRRRGLTTCLNRYELDTLGLKIKRFHRDVEWFEYIFDNRANRPDSLAQYDVIIGPIANDTLYDTWGIITSGLLQKEQALRLLTIGPVYEQTVIKSEKAASALRFIEAQEITEDEIALYRNTVRREEALFQEQFERLLKEMLPAEDL